MCDPCVDLERRVQSFDASCAGRLVALVAAEDAGETNAKLECMPAGGVVQTGLT
jgi:hypothetical protein